MDHPALKAKTSATEWILWKNAWQRYLRETGLGGHATVTQLWECLSGETAVGLINVGFWEMEDIDRLIEEIKKSVIGDLKKLSQWVKLSNSEQHNGDSEREYATRLRGKTDCYGLAVKCWLAVAQRTVTPII